ncbi:uncharacterized protein BDZ99DRAFT_528115 [Mytilinidion resinicola]|uniref:Rhodopsin domain-containing protein n=1 Tax=Mytilinidion resinicola TaxID=574789 RepID=A0A6A6XYR9_9PEZI|nr:uncharacterized protein BDZ99DRAFT_528115 [Mytilinidion resinicola]KAF2801642.1 hypothetical protein BDZ99DRAFT_528115 [Mytilinidion resinicola]
MATIIPAMPPPKGQEPDFYGRTPLQQKFILTYSCTFAAAFVFLGLRLYTRGCITKKFGWDDLAIVLAMVFSIAFFALCVVCMNYGFGRHMWDTPATAMNMYLKLLIGIVITYIWSPMLTKFSILILYHRVNPNKWFRICVYIIAFIITAYSLATIFIVGAGCQPTDASNGNCLNQLALWQAILNIVTDFAMMVMPLPMLYKLQMPLLQKMVLGFVFMVGSSVVFTSIVRITYIMHLQNKPDITYYEATACVWSSIELNFGVICNCLTVLKPFAKRHLPGLFSSLDASNSKSGSHPLSFFGRFRSKQDPASSGFKLSSMNGGTQTGKGEIVVTSTYRVEGKKGRDIESESMEDMITPFEARTEQRTEDWKNV